MIQILNKRGVLLLEVNADSLIGLNLSVTNLDGADFNGKNLRASNLSGCSLKNADFFGSNLSGVDLSNCDIDGAIFNNVRMQGTVTSGTSFRYINVENTDQVVLIFPNWSVCVTKSHITIGWVTFSMEHWLEFNETPEGMNFEIWACWKAHKQMLVDICERLNDEVVR